jgi:predicted permease
MIDLQVWVPVLVGYHMYVLYRIKRGSNIRVQSSGMKLTIVFDSVCMCVCVNVLVVNRVNMLLLLVTCFTITPYCIDSQVDCDRVCVYGYGDTYTPPTHPHGQ